MPVESSDPATSQPAGNEAYLNHAESQHRAASFSDISYGSARPRYFQPQNRMAA